MDFESYRNQPWAIMPEALVEIQALVAGRMSHAEIQTRLQAAAPAPAPSSEDGAAVAVLPLRGVITPRASFLAMLFGGSYGGLVDYQASLRAAVADPSVSAIVLDIDSPGGSSALVQETAELVRELRDEKTIVAIANVRAASAAYWIGSQASELVVTPSGEVGSVGALMIHDDVSVALEQAGIKTTIVKAGRYKAEGNPYEPLGREAKAEWQRVVDSCYSDFVESVAAGRGVTAADVESKFGQGRLVLAEDAVSAGMADRVETFEDTLARLGAAPDAPDADEEADEASSDDEPVEMKTDHRAAIAAALLPSE